eukprot:CAMPEP_0114670050 /NCGR_PEP_ID=MMETSP0191-20121206/38979_1 /TAXON_ID=126664 /ORGANISM="Sorites sp." /LENGTH=162 /DNA_ID=CAMNT_0001926923 /DNA_START=192 /DNA_END=680 /DNA_ORIENTATION=+
MSSSSSSSNSKAGSASVFIRGGGAFGGSPNTANKSRSIALKRMASKGPRSSALLSRSLSSRRWSAVLTVACFNKFFSHQIIISLAELPHGNCQWSGWCSIGVAQDLQDGLCEQFDEILTFIGLEHLSKVHQGLDITFLELLDACSSRFLQFQARNGHHLLCI